MPDQYIVTEEELSRFLAVVGAELASHKRFEELHAPQLAPGFNAIGWLEPNENRLSSVIAKLLDPNGGHGQGPLFLKKFLDVLINDWPENIPVPDMLEIIRQLDDLVLKKITDEPRCEVATFHIQQNQRRIDILLHFNTNDEKGFGIAIENKPWAVDQDDQLKAYDEHLKAQYKPNNDFIQIYLSGNGTMPAENSITHKEWDELARAGRLIMMSYFQLKSWCLLCAEKCRSHRVKCFLDDFAAYIQDNFEGGIPMIDEELVIKNAIAPNNIGAAFAVGSTWPKIATRLIHELAHHVERKLIAAGDTTWKMDIDFDDYSVKESGFCFYRKEKWSNYRIKFVFEQGAANSFVCGISKPTERISDDDRIIAEKLDKNYEVNGYPNTWWVWWDYFFPCRDWSANPEPWVGICENGKTVDTIYSKFQSIIKDVGADIDRIEENLSQISELNNLNLCKKEE